MHRIPAIIFFAGIFLVRSVSAQQQLNYFFRHIDQADGLLHNLALAIEQDSKGFIWVATPNGLQRYDGSRFVYYPEILSDPDEGFTYGAEMYADKKNNLLWIFKNATIERMELQKGRFRSYNSSQLSADSSFGFQHYKDSEGYSWLVGDNGVFFYDKNIQGPVITQENVVLAPANRSAYIIHDSSSRQFWIALSRKLYLFDEKTKNVYSDNFNPIQHPLFDPSLFGTQDSASRYLMIDSKKNIWVATWGNRLYRYDQVSGKLHTYFLSDIKSQQEHRKVSGAGLLLDCILEDDHHNIWIATENAGLLRYNREKDNFDYCIAEEKNSEAIQYSYKIFTVFQDKEQNIWVGTDKGISIFNPYRQTFQSIRHESNAPSISKNEIESFIQVSNGDMYIGTWGGGIAEYDKNYHFKKNILPGAPAENNFVWSFVQPDEKTLWAGCQHGFLLMIDLQTGKTKSMRFPETEGATIRCMKKDASGNIWMGLHNGKIIKWDSAEKKMHAYADGRKPEIKRLSVIFNLFIDAQQRCWVSTESGFKEFDVSSLEFINTWLPDKNNRTALIGKSCEGIEQYNDSTLIIGTIYGGLNFFNTKTKIFSHIDTKDGLPSNTVYAIKKDSSGYVWFTTDYGLYKFMPPDKKIIPYTIGPSELNTNFFSNSFYPLQNGQWLTFTQAEAISFFPGATLPVNDRPMAEITGVRVFDKPVFIDSILAANEPVRLAYDQNFITIEFASLDFSGLLQTNYFFRLSSVNKEWVNGRTERFASYTNLEPGEYTFEVKADNGAGTGDITSLKIIIHPPFWKTWWFRTIVILSVILLLYWIIVRRIRTIRREAGLKHKIAETEMMALRAQMNPHFIFNCINAIDNLIQTGEKDKATTYLARFAKLIRVVLDSSKNNVVPFHKEYEALNLYLQLEAFRCSNKFKYELIADDEIIQGDYKVPPLLIQPFIENAIHHGLMNKPGVDKMLSVKIVICGERIKYTITDNGVGRQRAQALKNINRPEQVSYGIQISKERVSLYNSNEKEDDVIIKDLFTDGSPSGTLVEISIKFYNG